MRSLFWILGGMVAVVAACSTASSDCDELGTCNPPPDTAVGAGGTGPVTGPTTSSGAAMGGGGASSSTTAAGTGGMVPASCNDGTKNGDETDADCGGSCQPCPNNADCLVATDCVSNLCFGMQCTACAGGQCASGEFCDEGTCRDQLETGTVCEDDGASCVSGFCVDGRCCMDACEGTCQRCDVTLMEGTCAVPVGMDPDDECAGPKVCLANGECS